MERLLGLSEVLHDLSSGLSMVGLGEHSLSDCVRNQFIGSELGSFLLGLVIELNAIGLC